jgi:high-affinity Fe2+/Pb2+ permease
MPLVVNYAPRKIVMYSVTDSELNTIASLSNSVYLTFFGLCAGALIAFAIVLSTVALAGTQQVIYVTLTAVSAVATLFFGIRSWTGYRAARDELRAIKSGPSL